MADPIPLPNPDPKAFQSITQQLAPLIGNALNHGMALANGFAVQAAELLDLKRKLAASDAALTKTQADSSAALAKAQADIKQRESTLAAHQAELDTLHATTKDQAARLMAHEGSDEWKAARKAQLQKQAEQAAAQAKAAQEALAKLG